MTELYDMIRPMSEADALLAVQFLRAADAGDIDTAESVLRTMPKESVKLLVAIMETELESRRRKSCENPS